MEFSHSPSPQGGTAIDFNQSVFTPGRIHRAKRNKPASVTRRRLQEVVVGLPGYGSIRPAHTHDHGGIHPGFIHGGNQFSRGRHRGAGVGKQRRQGSVPLGISAALLHKPGREYVGMKIYDHLRPEAYSILHCKTVAYPPYNRRSGCYNRCAISLWEFCAL